MTAGRPPSPWPDDPRRGQEPRPGRVVKKSPARGQYPVARPYVPPKTPPARPPQGPPQPARNPPRPKPPSDRWTPWALKAVVVLTVACTCTAVGWFMFRGPRPKRAKPAAEPVAVARVEEPRKAVAAPTPAPKEAEKPLTPPAKAATPTPSPEKAAPPPAPEKPKPAPEKSPAKPAAPQTMAVTFDKHILPIFRAKCINCHGGNAKKGGLDVRTVAALLKGGESGPSVKPGAPDQSPLWESIETNRMPPGKGKLTPAERDVVQAWIKSGAKPGGATTAQAK